MSDPGSFMLNQVTIDVGGLQPSTLLLVADTKPKNVTHVTLLMGANGTCKSRILTSIINLLRKLKMGHSKSVDHPSSRTTSWQDHDLECLSAVTTSAGQSFDSKKSSPMVESESLPSRILALANLVRDRFAFEDRQQKSFQFYHYLGVRQSSNLTTTGAMDRLVTDSVINLVANPSLFRHFAAWIQQLFPGCLLSLDFSLKSQKNFGLRIDRSTDLQELLGTDGPNRFTMAVDAFSEEINELLELLERLATENTRKSKTRRISLNLSQMLDEDLATLGRLSMAFDIACSALLLERPSLGVKRTEWLNFMQLSSGEQNLLSTGARLFGYARPRSLILIDEPEVSLNVAWQQRYIELILQAIDHAPGSHVIIASHSPYLVSDLKRHESTVVVIEKDGDELRFQSHAGEFWGWGAEAVLYEVLGIPSASNYHFSRELAAVLKLVRERSLDTRPIDRFLQRCDQLQFEGEAEPLSLVIEEIRAYLAGVQP